MIFNQNESETVQNSAQAIENAASSTEAASMNATEGAYSSDQQETDDNIRIPYPTKGDTAQQCGVDNEADAGKMKVDGVEAAITDVVDSIGDNLSKHKGSEAVIRKWYEEEPQFQNLEDFMESPDKELKKTLLFKYLFLNTNRKVNRSAVTKLKDGIRRAGMVMNAITVTTATRCLNEGQALYLPFDDSLVDLNALPHDELSKIFVVVDGQHRFMAVMELLQEGYPISFHLNLLPNNIKIIESLRIANETQQPWKGVDFIRQLACVVRDEKQKVMLEYIYSTIINKRAGNDAAWKFMTLDKTRAYAKAHIVDALNHEEKRGRVCDCLNFQSAKELFETIRGENGNRLAKASKVELTADWVIDKLNYLVRHNVQWDEAVKRMKGFFVAIPQDKVEEIEKHGKLSKGNYLTEQFDALFDEICSSDGQLKSPPAAAVEA